MGTIPGMVVDQSRDVGRPSLKWLVTILGMVSDYPKLVGYYPGYGDLQVVFDHPGHGRCPSFG